MAQATLEFRQGNATYVKKGPFRWYATWPCGTRYQALLGPYWFRWTCRRGVRRSIPAVNYF